MAAPATTPALSHGDHVVVRLPHVGLVPAMVEAASGASVTVALTVRDDRIARLIGQDAAIEIASGRGINRYLGTLKGDQGGLLTLALSGEVERIQRREFVRVEAILPVTVTGIETPVGGETTTLDISGRGIRIRDPWALELELAVRTAIQLPDATVEATGRVVRVAAEGERGIQFDDLAAPDEDRVIRFIREREVQMLRAKRGLQ
jgi:hypothetical protein